MRDDQPSATAGFVADGFFYVAEHVCRLGELAESEELRSGLLIDGNRKEDFTWGEVAATALAE